MPTGVTSHYLVLRRSSYRLVGITSAETEVLSVGSMKIRLLPNKMQDLVL